jgi:hypothetical protein
VRRRGWSLHLKKTDTSPYYGETIFAATYLVQKLGDCEKSGGDSLSSTATPETMHVEQSSLKEILKRQTRVGYFSSKTSVPCGK